MLTQGLSPSVLISSIITLIIAISVHESAHAYMANAFGDDTPRVNGRLTLNPLAHLDPIGSIMILFAGFGWGKPVPVNPYALQKRSSTALMWVSLAGPMSNFLLAILAAIPLRLGWVEYTGFSTGILPSGFEFFYSFISTNLLLMLFNLIPLAPLDGDAIAQYFLPASWERAWSRIRPYSPYILLAIVFLGPMLGVNILGWIMTPPLISIRSLLLGGSI